MPEILDEFISDFFLKKIGITAATRRGSREMNPLSLLSPYSSIDFTIRLNVPQQPQWSPSQIRAPSHLPIYEPHGHKGPPVQIPVQIGSSRIL